MRSANGWWVALVIAGIAAAAVDPVDTPDAEAFVGTWYVTSATNSIVLVVQPQGKATFILIQSGSHGMDNVGWRPMPGGILVDGIPRLRMWRGRAANEARVELEPLPPEAVESSLQQFPAAFFMKKLDAQRQLPKEWLNRPLPAGWDKEQLPTDWDATAGKRPKPASQ